MSRRLQKLAEDFETNPGDWEMLRRETTPSTNCRNRGGTSIQELLRHRSTGEEIVRHTLLTPLGDLFDTPHYRFGWK